jgi:hypothetical protein
MAHRNDDRAAVYGAAVGMLALGAALHYGWALSPPEHAAQVWNICGAVARAALLIAVIARIKHPLTVAVAAWWLAEEAMVAGCSSLYIARPWPVPPGQAQCSSLLGLDIGIFGGLAIMAILAGATVMVYRWQGGGNDEA